MSTAERLTAARCWCREIAGTMVREWRQDRVSGLAAEIAFFGLLGFFPTLVATAAALGFLEPLVGVAAAGDVRRQVLGFVSNALSEEANQVVTAIDRLFTQSQAGTLTVGLALALWAASRGFVATVGALDIAYDLDDRRGWLQTRLTALGLALGTAVVGAVLLSALAVGPLLGTGRELADRLGMGDGFALFWDWLRWPFAAGVVVVWTAVIFHIAPFHRTAWRWDVPGAVLSAILWVGVTGGLRLYLALARDTNPVFGTLGGALILIVWLYLLAMALIAGGELNAVLIGRYRVRQTPGRHWDLPGRLLHLVRSRGSGG
ncbi:MAG: YihY/virulence factor BrkB family protein [Acidimicrobiia bacterium]